MLSLQVLTTSQSLRYKDYHLASRPGPITNFNRILAEVSRGVFGEVESVKDFAAKMEELGVLDWWREAMGYDPSSNQI